MGGDWRELGRRLARVGLPTLGGALGGPLGIALGTEAARRIGAGEATPQEIMQTLESDPQAMLRLREIEAELAATEVVSQERLAEMRLADVKHARESVRDDGMRRMLAPFMIICPLAFAAFVLWYQPAEPAFSMAMLVIGYLIAQAERVASFYFGSSLGSQRKQEAIERMSSEERYTSRH